MTASEVAAPKSSLKVLRGVAAMGALLALVVVVFAFSVSLLVGLISIAVVPVVPLTLVVVADRVIGR